MKAETVLLTVVALTLIGAGAFVVVKLSEPPPPPPAPVPVPMAGTGGPKLNTGTPLDTVIPAVLRLFG